MRGAAMKRRVSNRSNRWREESPRGAIRAGWSGWERRIAVNYCRSPCVFIFDGTVRLERRHELRNGHRPGFRILLKDSFQVATHCDDTAADIIMMARRWCRGIDDVVFLLAADHSLLRRRGGCGGVAAHAIVSVGAVASVAIVVVVVSIRILYSLGVRDVALGRIIVRRCFRFASGPTWG